MCNKRGMHGLVAAAGYILAFLVFAAQAGAAQQAALEMGAGEQRTLNFPGKLSKVAVSDPSVAKVVASGESEVIVTGEASGTATLSIWLDNKDEPLVSSVVISSTRGRRSPLAMQVQTDIRIVEVNRRELNTLGLYYAKLFNGGESSIGLAPPGGGGFRGFGGAGSPAAGISSEGFNLFSFGKSSLSIINALESGGFAYTLAEPSLVSLSGQSATFLSGGEFPIPTQSNNNGVQIEYKEFGVSLALTPTVIEDDQIILKVAPEVSELDFTAGVATSGVAVPGLRIRRTETTVSMAPGESFIISGLVSKTTLNNSDRLPGLGNIPILGALFRSDRVSTEEKELIMVVTPRIVSPQKKMPDSVKRFGLEYESSSTEWPDMFMGTRKADEPIEHGLSW
ncbi:MAG: pilus assembly protein N-terminal domain-containing protein [Marinobacter sp.]